MILRCTRKLLDLLQPAEPLADVPAGEDDWYANLLWIGRRKCLPAPGLPWRASYDDFPS